MAVGGLAPMVKVMTVVRAVVMMPMMMLPLHPINVVDALEDVGTPPGAGMSDETRRWSAAQTTRALESVANIVDVTSVTDVGAVTAQWTSGRVLPRGWPPAPFLPSYFIRQPARPARAPVAPTAAEAVQGRETPLQPTMGAAAAMRSEAVAARTKGEADLGRRVRGVSPRSVAQKSPPAANRTPTTPQHARPMGPLKLSLTRVKRLAVRLRGRGQTE